MPEKQQRDIGQLALDLDSEWKAKGKLGLKNAKIIMIYHKLPSLSLVLWEAGLKLDDGIGRHFADIMKSTEK